MKEPSRGVRRHLLVLLACMMAVVVVPAAPAAAADPDFELAITWRTFAYLDRHSCDPTGPLIGGGRIGPHPGPECGAWERVNASMSVEGGTVVGPYRVRNIGTWGRGVSDYDRTENWSSTQDPDRPVFIGTSTSHDLADRPMCQTETYRWCRTGYQKNYNVVKIRGNYGDRVRLGFHAQTTDGQENCMMQYVSEWTLTQVKHHNGWNPKLVIMGATIDGQARDVCTASFQVVARRL